MIILIFYDIDNKNEYRYEFNYIDNETSNYGVKLKITNLDVKYDYFNNNM